MTSIAYDGNILACDSRSTAGTTIITDKCKKLWVLDAVVKYNNDRLLAYALSGSVSDFEYIRQYLLSEDFPCYSKLEHNIAGIFVGEKLVYGLEPKRGLFIQYNKSQKLSEGTGSEYCMMAMHLGCNAKDAVKHAIKYDSASGGRIQTWERS